MAKLNIVTLATYLNTTVTDAAKAKGLLMDIFGDVIKVPVADKLKIQDMGKVICNATVLGAQDVKHSKFGLLKSVHIITDNASVEFYYIANKCFKIEVSVHNRGPKWSITPGSNNFDQLATALKYEC